MNSAKSNRELLQADSIRAVSSRLPDPQPRILNAQPPAIPDHELLKKIGSGSYGEVWLARNIVGTLRAVKILYRQTFERGEHFEREFNGLQKFEPISRSHDGLVDILQIGRNDTNDCFYYIMELADDGREMQKEEGRMKNGSAQATDKSVSSFCTHPSYFPKTLRSLIRPAPQRSTLNAQPNSRRLPVSECIQIGLSLAGGLAHLHKQGLVHRDIKPSNIIFVEGTPKLADIGLVADISEARSFVGTTGFIAPEGPGTAQADLYSLGKVLYEISTGHDRQDFPALPPNLRELPDCDALIEFNEIVVNACANDPHRRYATAEELQTDLIHLQHGQSVIHKHARQRHLTLAAKAGLATGTVALVLAVGWLLSSRFDASTVRRFNSSEALAPAELKSIAVLPFDNDSPDKADEYLGAQIAEELSSTLTKIPDLRVMGRNSAVAIHRAENVRAEAQELKVSALLDGRVRKAGNKLHVMAQLLDAREGYQLWAEVYDRELPEIFGIQTDIAEKVGGKLSAMMTDTLRQRLALKPTRSLEAYRSYLEGRFFWNKRTEHGLVKSIGLFEHALMLDTNYALAWTGLADAWNALPDWGLRLPADCFPKAKEYAQRALALDPALAEAHAAWAKAAHLYDWEWSVAEEEFKRAIALNPNYASARQWYAELLGCRGRHDEAIAQMREAITLDPLSPIINRNLGRLLYNARRFDEAIIQLRKTVELSPDFGSAHGLLGDAYEEIARPQEAISEWLLYLFFAGESAETMTAFEKASLSGPKGYWEKHLETLLETAKHDYVAPAFLAQNYARLGQTNQALDWLEKACQERSPLLLFIKVTPLFDNLRSEPRFIQVLRKVGLER